MENWLGTPSAAVMGLDINAACRRVASVDSWLPTVVKWRYPSQAVCVLTIQSTSSGIKKYAQPELSLPRTTPQTETKGFSQLEPKSGGQNYHKVPTNEFNRAETWTWSDRLRSASTTSMLTSTCLPKSEHYLWMMRKFLLRKIKGGWKNWGNFV